MLCQAELPRGQAAELGQRRKAQSSGFGKPRAGHTAGLSAPWAGRLCRAHGKFAQEDPGTRSWGHTMDQVGHSFDLQKLMITQLTKVIKNSTAYFWIP